MAGPAHRGGRNQVGSLACGGIAADDRLHPDRSSTSHNPCTPCRCAASCGAFRWFSVLAGAFCTPSAPASSTPRCAGRTGRETSVRKPATKGRERSPPDGTARWLSGGCAALWCAESARPARRAQIGRAPVTRDPPLGTPYSDSPRQPAAAGRQAVRVRAHWSARLRNRSLASFIAPSCPSPGERALPRRSAAAGARDLSRGRRSSSGPS
jgi:hypothetical protein